MQSILFPGELKEAEAQSASDDRRESTISKDTGPKSLADGEKAPVDLFKAVFQDSDDSEDSDSDSSDEEQVTGTVMFEPKTKDCRKNIQSRSNPRFNLLDIKVGRYLVGQMYVKVASYTYGFISISLDPVSLLCCLLLRRSKPPAVTHTSSG